MRIALSPCEQPHMAFDWPEFMPLMSESAVPITNQNSVLIGIDAQEP